MIRSIVSGSFALSAFSLREAAVELRRTFAEIEADADYHDEEFQAAMAHAYHHLNTASRTPRIGCPSGGCTLSDFARWRQFPSDIDLSPG